MKALLVADWLRMRRRLDLWIIVAVVCLIGGIGYLAAYHSDVQDPPAFNLAEFNGILDGGFFNGLSEQEIAAQRAQLIADQEAADGQAIVDRNAEQLILLQKYDLIESPFTVINSGLVPIIALILLATLVVGDEFRFGTVRTSLLAAGSRPRFLAARLVSLTAITVGLYLVLVLLGVALAVILRVVGAEMTPSTIGIDGVAGLAWLAMQIVATMVLIALGTALTVLLRSGALPLLLVLLGALIELFVANLPVFGPGQFLAGVPQVFLTTNLRQLSARLGLDSHALALGDVQVAPQAIDLPLVANVAIVLAWGILFLVIADRRFRSMDIVE